MTLKVVRPQFATLREEPPKGEGWLHEIKYDGYRIIALVQDGAVKLITRNEQDWTHRYEPVADALTELDVKDAIFDGEVVVLDRERRRVGADLDAADPGELRCRTLCRFRPRPAPGERRPAQ